MGHFVQNLLQGETIPDSADASVLALAEHVENVPLPSAIKNETDLDRALRPIVREYVRRELGPEAKLFTHGETKEEKREWTKSKPLQNIAVYGFGNTGDIFISDARLKREGYEHGGIYVELKFASARSPDASTLPGDLQRSVGQSLIASLRHPFVICLIVCQRPRVPAVSEAPEDAEDRRDRSKALCRMLWQKHRIALVVRGAETDEARAGLPKA